MGMVRMVASLFLVQERCRKSQEQASELLESKRESKQSQGRRLLSLIHNITVSPMNSLALPH